MRSGHKQDLNADNRSPGSAMSASLFKALQSLASTPRLLVGCDYDGTLAELVEDPSRAVPDPEAVEALRALEQLHDTAAVIVSGRSLAELNTFLGDTDLALRVGSHGAEWEEPGLQLTSMQRWLLDLLHAGSGRLVGEIHGLRRELKPAGVALHTRGLGSSIADRAIAGAVEELGGLPGIHMKRGDEVIEFMVLPANKGEAMLRIKEGWGATAVFFIGDDLTDEDVFAVLGPEDLGVRVGHGDTCAAECVTNTAAVATVLKTLADLRRAAIGRRRSVS
jgi:trehalose-phosphatase